jgi:hypothetical protein
MTVTIPIDKITQYVVIYFLISLGFIILFLIKNFYRTGRIINDSEQSWYIVKVMFRGMFFPLYLLKELTRKPDKGQICISCHFLIGRKKTKEGDISVDPLRIDQRHSVLNGDNHTFIDESINVECYKKATIFAGFSNTGNFFTQQKCTFWVPYKEYMDLSTMDEQSKILSTKWTNIRSWIAIGISIAVVVIQIILFFLSKE